jgi:uncharacterized OsmC-like protein
MLYISPALKGIVERQLSERSARPAGEAPRPVTTVKSTALFDVQFRATVEGHEFISDEGEHGGGHDAGPAPLRYFLAGIMMCHQVWLVKSSAVEGVQLDRLECQIAGYVGPVDTSDPLDRNCFTRLEHLVDVDSPNSAADVQRVVELAAHRCAAFVAIKQTVPIDMTIQHNGVKIAELRFGPKVMA